MKTYELRATGETWTVIEYEDGTCRGGDAHWLDLRDAEAALAAYRSGEAVHPDFRVAVR